MPRITDEVLEQLLQDEPKVAAWVEDYVTWKEGDAHVVVHQWPTYRAETVEIYGDSEGAWAMSSVLQFASRWHLKLVSVVERRGWFSTTRVLHFVRRVGITGVGPGCHARCTPLIEPGKY